MPSSKQSQSQLRVAVVADTERAAQRLTSALSSPHRSVCSFSLLAPQAPRQVLDMVPSVVLVRAAEGNLGVIAHFAQAARRTGAALVLLTPRVSPETIRFASRQGAMTQLLEPVTTQALTAAVIVSSARARDYHELQLAARGARQLTAVRDVVEQAKQVLMHRFGLTEAEAHRLLQRESRSRNRKLIETAHHVLRADTKFPRRPGRSAASLQTP